MTEKPDVAALKADSDNAERQYKETVKLMKVARADTQEALKEATRARIKYMRAMGAVADEEMEQEAESDA